MRGLQVVLVLCALIGAMLFLLAAQKPQAKRTSGEFVNADHSKVCGVESRVTKQR